MALHPGHLAPLAGVFTSRFIQTLFLPLGPRIVTDFKAAEWIGASRPTKNNSGALTAFYHAVQKSILSSRPSADTDR